MILYLFKLILILIFNIGINTYYINSGCNCCCCRSKQTDTGSGGSKSNSDILPGGGWLEKGDLGGNKQKQEEERGEAGDKKGKEKEEKKNTSNTIEIEFDKANNKITIDLKNLKLSSKNIPEGIVNESFTCCTTFGKLDKSTYNLFTTDIKITFKNKPDENKFVLFAVKTTSGGYYLGCCNNVNRVEGNCLFIGSKHNNEIKMLYIGGGLNNINLMFSGNRNLENIVFTNCFDTSNVTDMSFMFSGCSSLKELNLSNFNTNNVTDMNYMFNGCSSLKELNLSTFNTSKVENMSYMFNECSSLKELNLSTFDTSKVDNMTCMFYGCSSLKKLNLSNFNTSSYMTLMFYGCTALKAENLIGDKKIKDALNAPVK